MPHLPHAFCLLKMASLALLAYVIGAATPASAEDRYTVSLTPLPAITRDNGEVTAKFIGFLQLDAVGQKARQNDPPSGTSVRRARLGLAGQVSAQWGYKWVYEFAGPKNELQDGFITYQPRKNNLTIIGQHKDPVGLEWQSAAKYWTFHELPLLTALTPRRAIGVSHRWLSDHWRIHAGLFGENHSQARTDDEGYSTTAHLVWYPLASESMHFHIGSSLRQQRLNTGNQTFALKAKHESSVTTAPLLKAPPLATVDGTQLLSAELLWLYRTVLLQGEIARLTLDNLENYEANSAYVQAAWMVSGNGRQFNRASHGFKRVTVKGPSVIELALRAEILDFNAGIFDYGKMTKYSFATNWHMTDTVKLSMNASVATTDEYAALPNARVKSLGLRAQLDF